MTDTATKKVLGFGIVGVGMIARFHARAIAEVSGARLVAVTGRSPEKVKAFAAEHGGVAWFTSLDDFLARPDLDVVCIATPSGAHLEPAVAAARAGKHLLVEKPIEVTLDRCDELLRAVEQAGVCLAPVFQARFGPGARAVKDAIDAGRLGRLILASAYVKWYRSAEYYRDSWHGTLALDGGGALMNQAIHAVDLLQWFAGMPAEVAGRVTRRVHTGIEAEDTGVAHLRFPSGALGVIEASTAAFPGFRRRLELCGETGSIVLEDDEITRWEFRESLPKEAAIRTPQAEVCLGSGAAAPNAITHEGHRLQIEDLVAAIRSGRSTAISGSEARNAVRIIRAIYDSSAQGRAVVVH